jgi:hypothetical protein
VPRLVLAAGRIGKTAAEYPIHPTLEDGRH